MKSNLLAAKQNLADFYEPGKALGNNATYAKLLTPIIQNAILIIAIISFFTLLFAGFTYITSGGDEAKIKQASAMLNYAIIGIVLAGASFLITNIIGSITGFRFFG